MSVWLRGLATLVVVGCQIPSVDLTGKVCPCPSGWTCDEATSTCARASASDASEPCAPGGLFCDGFESGDTSRWATSDLTSSATLAVQPTTVHAGTYALDATVPPITNGAIAAVVARFPGQSTGMLAVRAWLYLPQPLIHFDSVITLFGAPDHLATVDADDNGHWTVTETSMAGTSVDHHSSIASVDDTWTCIELDYQFPQGGGAAMITLDLSDALVLATTAIDPAAIYTEVRVGVSRADAAGSHVLADDVVIATQHVGCD